MEYVLKTTGLTKVYGNNKVVDNVSFNIEKGHIYGLIGPNGAGKTTIMKMIAGTCMPTAGSISLFEQEDKINDMRSRASFMIEAPYLDGSMTARENMEYIRYLRGIAKEEKIDEVLSFVGLAHTGKKKVKHFSLGMRQRLGIGMALLPDPEIMILDEPVNGLDPEGIVEVRNMLTKLCTERGITILISSHLLSELSELCTDFTIIDKGKIIESISKEELSKKCRSYIAVAASDTNRLATVIEQKLGISEYKVIENNEIRIYERLDEVETISRTIMENDIVLTKLNAEGENLEEYYLSRVSSQGGSLEGKPEKLGLFGFMKGGK